MGHESHESHSFTSPCPCGAAGLVKKRAVLAAPEPPFSLLLMSLIGLGAARANGMMAARAVVHGFCARSEND